MKVGDLVRVISTDDDLVYGVGVYLGIETTWKDWYMVHVVHPKGMSSPVLTGTPFDKPYWKLDVISKV